MNEEEIFEELKQGAILFVPDSGDLDEAKIVANDDLPVSARACFRASKLHEERSFERRCQCPNCLENEAESILLDADSNRGEGNADIARKLKVDAAELRLGAARVDLPRFRRHPG
jgi:hypothetical protein